MYDVRCRSIWCSLGCTSLAALSPRVTTPAQAHLPQTLGRTPPGPMIPRPQPKNRAAGALTVTLACRCVCVCPVRQAGPWDETSSSAHARGGVTQGPRSWSLDMGPARSKTKEYAQEERTRSGRRTHWTWQCFQSWSGTTNHKNADVVIRKKKTMTILFLSPPS